MAVRTNRLFSGCAIAGLCALAACLSPPLAGATTSQNGKVSTATGPASLAVIAPTGMQVTVTAPDLALGNAQTEELAATNTVTTTVAPNADNLALEKGGVAVAATEIVGSDSSNMDKVGSTTHDTMAIAFKSSANAAVITANTGPTTTGSPAIANVSNGMTATTVVSAQNSGPEVPETGMC